MTVESANRYAAPSGPELRSTGRLHDAATSQGDRNYAMWIHLSTLLGFLVIGPFAFVVPLIMWQVRKQSGPFLDDHGEEVMNLWITGVGLFVLGMLTGIGVLLWLVWSIVQLINIVRGCIAASTGEYFRYPMLVRLLKR